MKIIVSLLMFIVPFSHAAELLEIKYTNEQYIVVNAQCPETNIYIDGVIKKLQAAEGFYMGCYQDELHEIAVASEIKMVRCGAMVTIANCREYMQ